MLVPAYGPPPHRHDFEEMFYMLENELEVTFRDEQHRIGPGHAINIPANAPHAFRVASAMPARFLCLCLPAGQDELFKLAGEVLPTQTSPPAVPSPERLSEIRGLMMTNALRFKSKFLPPKA